MKRFFRPLLFVGHALSALLTASKTRFKSTRFIALKSARLYARTRPAVLGIAALLCIFALIVVVKAQVQTFVVNNTGDAPDATTTDGVCDTDLTTNGSQCSLRAAIQQANASAGTQDIDFNIPGPVGVPAGVQTISPTSALPSITGPTTINGYSQPGSSANTNATGGLNTVLRIALDGTIAGNTTGLDIASNNVAIRGLNIRNFTGGGIGISGTGTNNVIVAGCFIGTNITGTAAAPTGNGISIIFGAQNNTIGGTTAAARNLISGNTFNGVGIGSTNTSNNLVQGNLIGTTANGLSALANGAFGVTINTNASTNTIGGIGTGTRNVISGNAGAGVAIDFGCNNNTIQGNSIGYNANSSGAVGNDGGGVRVEGIGNQIISNTIVGNTTDGINVGTASNMLIQNNNIGFTGLGNTGNGISIVNTTSNNNITGNLITANAKGVAISSTNSIGNSIRNNTIESNTGLGIDLNDDGVTANDVGDADSGPNNLQNYPVITGITTPTAGAVAVAGTLNSTASTSFAIEVYANTAADPSGFGEGQTFLGTQTVTTNAAGNANFSITGSANTTDFFTATATNTTTGDTSEFSASFLEATSTVVINTNDTGLGTLRRAITNANSNGGLNTIRFNIPAANIGDVQSIKPGSALPFITAAGTIIDGTTQPGYAGTPLIQLDGVNAGASVNGLLINGVANCVVKALNIGRFTATGLVIINAGATNNTVQSCFIGVDAAGTTAFANGAPAVGIFNNANNNIVGGTTAAQRNILSGNAFEGVSMGDIGGAGSGPVSGNIVRGNYIGTDVTGTQPIPNGRSGVAIFGASPNNVIGGTASGAGNVISGNTGGGVIVTDAGSTGNMVQGNFIGLNAAGNAAIASPLSGVTIRIGAQNNTIGGTMAASRNIISGNTNSGVLLTGTATNSNTVTGNYIGTNAAGTAAIPNNTRGVFIGGGANANTIGGVVTGAGNVISGNNGDGINFSGGTSNTIQGNFIGVAANGTTAIPNTNNGITLNTGDNNNIIGGIAARAGNTIAFNGTGANATNGDGVHLFGGTGNSIRGNSIHDNKRLGIDLVDANNTVAGVTPNDAGDADTGPNNLQNFPVISGVTFSGGNTVVSASLNSVAGTYAIDLFSNTAADPSGNGEGETFEAAQNVTVPAGGSVAFSFTRPGTITKFFSMTATRNGAPLDTSEFSNAVRAASGPTITSFTPTSGPRGTIVTITGTGFTGATQVEFGGGATDNFTVVSATQITATVPGVGATGLIRVTTPAGAGTSATNFTVTAGYIVTNKLNATAGSLRDAINYANANAGTTISFGIPAAQAVSGVFTIAPTAALPDLSSNSTIINGSTQPGFVNTPIIVIAPVVTPPATQTTAFTITGSSCTLRSLVLNANYGNVVITSANANNNTVRDCYIGVNAAGTAAVRCFKGVSLENGAHDNLIGLPNAGNLISGNDMGIWLLSAGVNNNQVQGNRIGINAAGTAAIANQIGVLVANGAQNNIIGGTATNAGNVISGNTFQGVAINNTGSNGNQVLGNFIGITSTNVKIPNGAGVLLQDGSKNNIIGGTAAGSANIIAANTNAGVTIDGSNGVATNNVGTDNNTVQGNFIGTHCRRSRRFWQ